MWTHCFDYRDAYACPGDIKTWIVQPPPFFFLDVGFLWIPLKNAQDLLGGIIRIQQEQYLISAMTIYNTGHPDNKTLGHYYNHMYIRELHKTITYDTHSGISMDSLNDQRRAGPQTVCILMLLRISSS